MSPQNLSNLKPSPGLICVCAPSEEDRAQTPRVEEFLGCTWSKRPGKRVPFREIQSPSNEVLGVQLW